MERRFDEPRTERERAAAHFGVPVTEVTPEMIEKLPPRGAGLEITRELCERLQDPHYRYSYMMKMAWKGMRERGLPFGEALSTAWRETREACGKFGVTFSSAGITERITAGADVG